VKIFELLDNYRPFSKTEKRLQIWKAFHDPSVRTVFRRSVHSQSLVFPLHGRPIGAGTLAEDVSAQILKTPMQMPRGLRYGRRQMMMKISKKLHAQFLKFLTRFPLQ